MRCLSSGWMHHHSVLFNCFHVQSSFCVQANKSLLVREITSQAMDTKAERTSIQLVDSSTVTTEFNLMPIGYLRSCFKTKNGTPRQPSVCSYARAKLTIMKSVFNHPEHSLQRLEEYSHVWLIFIFHQNASLKFTKAKIKPPRLNGEKIGVFACRSPYRPNPIGLTLAKIEEIKGDTIHLSGVDIIDGTPVLDIKPFIPEYDAVYKASHVTHITEPQTHEESKNASPPTQIKSEMDYSKHHVENVGGDIDISCRLPSNHTCTSSSKLEHEFQRDCVDDASTHVSYKFHQTSQDMLNGCQRSVAVNSVFVSGETSPKPLPSLELNENKSCINSTAAENMKLVKTNSGQSWDKHPHEYAYPTNSVNIPDWVHSPPINKLTVRFTAHAEQQLKELTSGMANSHPLEFFQTHHELRQAICDILLEDPRSTFRRNQCQDKLYFFPLDTAHITCWFGEDFVEVLRIQPISSAQIPSKT